MKRFSLLFLIFLFFSIHSQAFFGLEVREFYRGSQKFYAIAMSQWSLTPDIAEIDAKIPRTTGNLYPEGVLDIQKIFFEGHRLADSPDFQEAMRAERKNLLGKLGSKINDPSYVEQNGVRILEAYADYFKWKEYKDQKTIPEGLDFEVLKKESPLLRDGTMVVLILDGQKNFAGMVSMVYPTEKHPLVPAQELHQKLVAEGFESPFSEIKNPLTEKDLNPIHRLGRILESGIVQRFITPDQYRGEAPRGQLENVVKAGNLNLEGHPSLMPELKGIVRNPKIFLEIMTWSAYLLETMRMLPSIGYSTILNNGPGGGSGVHLSEGVYLGVSNQEVFEKVHQKLGWKWIATVGDTIFMFLSREAYLNIYLKGQLKMHEGVDFLSQVFRRYQERNAGWEPYLKGVDKEARAVTQEIQQILFPSKSLIGLAPSCRKTFRKK